MRTFYFCFLAMLHLGYGDLNFTCTVRDCSILMFYWRVKTRIDQRQSRKRGDECACISHPRGPNFSDKKCRFSSLGHEMSFVSV